MSSLTAIAPGVSYHLASEKIDTGSGYSCSVRDSSTSSDGTRYDSQGVNESDYTKKGYDARPAVTVNFDAALRESLSGHAHSGARVCLDFQSKDINRSISFHESSAPSLDVIIRQRIQNLPKHLILTDDTVTPSSKPSHSRDTQLCSDAEIEQYCRSGCQYVPRQPLGLSNTGNTCYLNSVIQCILATGPLLAYISRKHSIPGQCPILTSQTNAKPGEPNKNRFCGLCGISRLLREHTGQTTSNAGFRLGYGGTTQTVPSYFVCNVRAICPNLRPYQQEDAHEFLLGLLSRMEDSAVAGLGKLSKPVLETNVIRRIFGSIVRSEVTCHACSKVSARDEPCFNLSVDVTCGRSLQQCLFNYIRNEELCGQNAYKCENCRQLRPAVRRSTIFQGAPILVIQFNRFSRNQKLDTRVEFPASFNLRPFMTESKGTPVLYRLYATVNHEGYSCRSGHYVAFTRRNGTWLSHNDSFVNSTNPDHVLRQSPYLLFYEAVEPTTKPQSPTGSAHTNSSPCTPLPNGGKLKTPASIPVSTNPSLLTIPVSQIPLPAHSPPIVLAKANNNKAVTSPTSAPNSCSSTPNKQQPPPSTSVPRIVFNQSVVRKLPQPLTLGPARSPLASSTSSVKDNLPRPNPSLCSGSLGIRKLLYGDAEPPGLWTERPTPALNGSPLEKSTLNSPSMTQNVNGQNESSFGSCKRKRSPSSPGSSQSSKKNSPPIRDCSASPRRSNEHFSRSVSVKHTTGSYRSSPRTPARSPSVRLDDRFHNHPRSVSRSHSKRHSHRRTALESSFSSTSSGHHGDRCDRDYHRESRPHWHQHKHRKLGEHHHRGHRRNSSYRKHSRHPFR